MAQRSSDRRICVAKIGAPHGLRGEVRLWSYTSDPQAVADYGVLESEDGTRRIEIEALRPAKDALIARLKGVGDRTAAEGLRNLELFMPRDRLPAIEEDDEFYYADLVGLNVVDTAGQPLGEIIAVHNFGAGDLLEIKLSAMRDTVLIPFTDATVPEIDIAAKRIVIAAELSSGSSAEDSPAEDADG